MPERLITPEGEALARIALANIDADPDSFNQNSWGYATSCGTVACLAGHIVMAAGATLNEPLASCGAYQFQGRLLPAGELAVQLTGIDWPSAYALFEASNDREDLGRMVDDLAAGRPIATSESSEFWSEFWDEDHEEDGL